MAWRCNDGHLTSGTVGARYASSSLPHRPVDSERTGRRAMSTFTRQHLMDLRGLGRLAADATTGITTAVESLHHTIARVPIPIGARRFGASRGITGLVYSSIRTCAALAGRGLDAVLAAFTQWLPDGPPTLRQEALRAVVNGVYGDHLAATGNPLAITMRLRRDGRPLTLTRAALGEAIPDPAARVLVLVHGLCTSDLHWRRNGHDHGARLARDLGYTPL
jgi:hypothetical protein